eukprot:scaffold86423_cov33-Tisochrysis_lutea.AAC.2
MHPYAPLPRQHKADTHKVSPLITRRAPLEARRWRNSSRQPAAATFLSSPRARTAVAGAADSHRSGNGRKLREEGRRHEGSNVPLRRAARQQARNNCGGLGRGSSPQFAHARRAAQVTPYSHELDSDVVTPTRCHPTCRHAGGARDCLVTTNTQPERNTARHQAPLTQSALNHAVGGAVAQVVLVLIELKRKCPRQKPLDQRGEHTECTTENAQG